MLTFFARRGLVVLLLSLLVFSAPQAATASGEGVRQFFSQMADSLTQFYAGRGIKATAISFTGPPTFKTGGTTAIVQILSEELEKRGIAVVDRAALAIKGNFVFTREADVSVTIDVVDSFGESVVDLRFEGTLVGEAELLNLVGVPVDLNGLVNDRRRQEQIVSHLVNPQSTITGTFVRSSDRSPYAVDILVNDQPLTPETRAGLPYVNLERGDQYAVRLVNASNREAAVSLAIDGLSIFHFSELRATDRSRLGEPEYRYWIVAPQSTLTVRGWHKNNQRSQALLITSLNESAAAKVGHTADVGTITANFHASWSDGQRPPGNEFSAGKIVRYVREGNKIKPVFGYAMIATGFGQEILTNTRGVRRHVGSLRSSVTVRYDKPQP